MQVDKQKQHSTKLLAGELADKVQHLGQKQRFMLGLVGYPGAGKSTVSAALVDAVNDACGVDVAIVVPMDGYHFPNEQLVEMNLLPLKGIPDTFDAKSFVELLRQLRAPAEATVYAPLFDRSIEASIERGISIEPHHKLLVVEGNYLLMDRGPWTPIQDILDEIWFLEVDMDEIIARLLERHRECGRTESGAKEKMESTDLPNAKLIEETKKRAHRVLDVCLDGESNGEQ